MSRKILKILISLLFLAASAVAAIFALKSFHESVTTKYGIADPVFIEDNITNKQNDEVKPESNKPITYAPVDNTTRYGVAYDSGLGKSFFKSRTR